MTNNEQFTNWVEQVKKAGQAIKYGYYKEDDRFIDRGTLYPYEFSISTYDPEKIIEVTPEHFICQRDNITEHHIGFDPD